MDAPKTRIVRCCHCRGMMRVPGRALSVFCPHCQTRVTLESLRIVGAHPGKKLATCGDIIVEASARLNLEITAQRVLVRGRVRGPVLAWESVEVGPGGEVIGDIKAPKLVVQDGGRIQGRFERTRRWLEPPMPDTPSPPHRKDVAPEPRPAASPPAGPEPVSIRPQPLPPPRSSAGESA